MVKNLPCNVGSMGLIPGQGTWIPHATEQLSPRATIETCPMQPNKWILRKSVIARDYILKEYLVDTVFWFLMSGQGLAFYEFADGFPVGFPAWASPIKHSYDLSVWVFREEPEGEVIGRAIWGAFNLILKELSESYAFISLFKAHDYFSYITLFGVLFHLFTQ